MPPRKWPLLIFVLLAIAALSFGTACQSVRDVPSTQASPVSKPVIAEPLVQSDDVIIFAGVGDIMLGTTYPDESKLPPDDGANLLTEVTPILARADIAFGNLEGPMLEGGKTTKCPPASKRCFAFRVPTRYGKYLKAAGFDVMSLANNHSSDFNEEGRTSSQKVLEELGIAHAGGDTTDVAYLTVKGRKIAVVAFATNRVSLNLNDIATAKRAVTAAAKKASIVIVSFHGGAEGVTNQHVPRGAETYLGEARGDLRAFTHAVIDAGAHLVIGHGPHVIRGMEVYRGRLIAYSLGNFATYGKFQLAGATALSMILEVKLGTDGTFLGGRINPARQDGLGGPRLDENGAIIPVVRQLSSDDFGASAVRIADDGTIAPPAALNDR